MPSPLLRFAQRLFLAIGIVTLAYAGGTAAYAELYQRYQSHKFEPVRTVQAPGNLVAKADEKTEIAEPAELNEGDPVGKLVIPRLGISVVVLHGVEDDTLRVGAGHVPGTPLPGADGNSAIAAHRDTFFRKLEGIKSNDLIEYFSARGEFHYLVDSTEIVEPADTRPMESRGVNELTLISCFPFYFIGSAPQRFIVHARLAN